MEKIKPVYSKNEKILRAFCIAVITVCAIIGILLFILSKPILGAIILVSCAISAFLLTSFFIGFIKAKVGHLPKKRIIYAAVYILIILICMVTTLIAANSFSNNYEEMRAEAIAYAEQYVKTVAPVSKIIEVDVVEAFELSDSYYFEIEAVYDEIGVGGTALRQYSFIYLKVNKYTGTITELDFKQYNNNKTFLK